MEKGELYWVDFGHARESEAAYRRPALIVQADNFNRSAIPSILVAPLTGNIQLAKAPGNVLLRAQESQLSKDSCIVISQVTPVNRKRLEEYIGTIDPSVLLLVDNGLKLIFDL